MTTTNLEDIAVLSHVAPPKSSSSLFADSMDSSFPKKPSSSSSRVQVEESDEARKKFSNTKSISYVSFFRDPNKSANLESKSTLEVIKDFWSSLVNKAGKIKDKLVEECPP